MFTWSLKPKVFQESSIDLSHANVAIDSGVELPSDVPSGSDDDQEAFVVEEPQMGPATKRS